MEVLVWFQDNLAELLIKWPSTCFQDLVIGWKSYKPGGIWKGDIEL